MSYLISGRKVQLEHCLKRGKKNVCFNYRPVSITYVVGKLLESLIRDVLLNYIELIKKMFPTNMGYLCSSQ